MTDRVLVDSDAELEGPVFTGPDEEAVAPADPPDVTVVSRSTGDTLDPPVVTAVEGEGNEGRYTVTLTAADHTGELDILDLTWSGEIDGKLRTYTQTVEVVGGFYVSIPTLRTIQSLTSKPVAQLRRFRSEIEDKCEEARGTAYVPRCAVETFTQQVRLKHRHVQRVTAVRLDGEAVDPARFHVDPVTRTVTCDGGFTFQTEAVFAYIHGYPSPPQALEEAARIFVRAKVTRDSSDANRNPSSVTNLATQEVYRFTTADPKFGRWTDIDEVNEKINSVPDERALVR